MKRFTETNKWSDPWFQDLKPEHKLLWLYICDQCDNAGVWQINLRLAGFCIGYAYPNDTLSVAFGDRIKDLGGGKIWVCKFCAFQYGRLTTDCRPHVSVIQRLTSLNLVSENDRVCLGLANPTGKGQEKEKEKEGGKGGNKNMQLVNEARLIIHYLNEQATRSFGEGGKHLEMIMARLREVNGDVEGIKTMVRRQCARWKHDPKMSEYLRPATLFNREKFHSYYDDRDLPVMVERNGKTVVMNPGRTAEEIEREIAATAGKPTEKTRQIFKELGL